MKKTGFILCACLLAATPVFAKSKNSDSTTIGSTAPVAAPVDPSSAPAAPTPAPAPVAAADEDGPVKINPALLSPGTIKGGDLTFTDMHASMHDGVIDVSVKIENGGKADDKITGADIPSWEGISVALVDKGGKEQPVELIIPAGGKVEFTSGNILRVKGSTKAERSTGIVPLTLYFRRGPNTTMKLAIHGGAGVMSDIKGWFGK